jgi:hypothetical protein
MGCLAYEVLNGTPPFISGDPMEMMRLHRQQVPAELPSSMNALLKRLTMRLLLKDPVQRPQDARDVEETLSRVTIGAASVEAVRLQALAATHMSERAAADAAEQARWLAMKEAKERREQAIRDLEAIVEEGHDLVIQALPDVRYERRGSMFSLNNDEAQLDFVYWNDHPQHQRQRFALLGEVRGSNRRRHDEPPLGNLACEITEDRLVWYLYRYRMGAFGPPSSHGTPNRPYGFAEREYFGDKVFPFAFRDWKGLHTFRGEHQLLGPQSIELLYGAALALPNDFG